VGYRATNVGVLCLILALLVSTSLVAVTTDDTNAYFTDVHGGTMTGAYAERRCPDRRPPCRVEGAGSKSLHWGHGDNEPAPGDTIAQRDEDGSLHLDFGEERAGRGDVHSEVVRLVSSADDVRAVSFRVTGQMADFVTSMQLGKGSSCVLGAGATQRVEMDIRVPDDALAGLYTGTLVIHVQGWADDIQLPMTITVRDKQVDNGAIGEVVIGAGQSQPAGPSTEATDTPQPGNGDQQSPSDPPATPPTPTAPLVLPAVPSTSTPAPSENATEGVSGV
jgi:hypothetical protein